jgi:hypothetical protein
VIFVLTPNEERLTMHPSEHNPDDLAAAIEMPRYKSHKHVRALEIASADRLTCRLTFKDEGYAPIKASAEMWLRYQPVAGDFYVQYADGYKSFSPRKAFLDGYTRE